MKVKTDYLIYILLFLSTSLRAARFIDDSGVEFFTTNSEFTIFSEDLNNSKFTIDARSNLNIQVVEENEDSYTIKLNSKDGRPLFSEYKFSIRDTVINDLYVKSEVEKVEEAIKGGGEGLGVPLTVCDNEEVGENEGTLIEEAPSEESIKKEVASSVKDEPRIEKSKVGACAHFDKFAKEFEEKGLSLDALKQAFSFYQKDPSQFKENPDYISIADYSVDSKNKRFAMMNIKTGEVSFHQASHGGGPINNKYVGDERNKNSGAGIPRECTHKGREVTSGLKEYRDERKKLTRSGFMKTSKLYTSGQKWEKWDADSKDHEGKSSKANGMRMEGLSEHNQEVSSRGVVMHEGTYNRNLGVGDRLGRSNGCPAFIPPEGREIMKKINGGSLFYSYVPQCKEESGSAIKQSGDWENVCQ